MSARYGFTRAATVCRISGRNPSSRCASAFLLVCGWSTNPLAGHQRIIGGNAAEANSIPWQVLLSIDGNRAGGMVIADRWILTAAHVLFTSGVAVLPNSVRVSDLRGRRPGALPVLRPHRSFPAVPSVFVVFVFQIYMGLNTVENLSASAVRATSIHIHPAYNNPNLVDFNNDIALIKLPQPVTFGASVMPICLPEEGSTRTVGIMG